ncbi:ATP-dependent DNA ligase [Streptomyces sp. NTH33]|uniref:ATP-dependent DNA ligase n=1 Tax=Streptomyces sp. NTH33 TaxID=1735453 RepID=UPI0021AC0C26|nr:ATP-dependent DNA ligase [Streptomyces sp. NTH33]
MTPTFPEIVAGAAQLPDATALDGELAVWEEGRSAFEHFQGRLQRLDAGADRLARQWPAHFAAFDLLRLAGTDTTRWPYRRRRAALERLFTDQELTWPWALSPLTTDPATAREWLTWTAAGLEGLVFKRLDDPYRGSVRGRHKYKVLQTQRDRRGGHRIAYR